MEKFVNNRIMSRVCHVDFWNVRHRHGRDFASCVEDLEDDTSSSLLVSFLVQRSRSWAKIIGDVLWIASAAFIVYIGDRRSNFFYLLWGDNRIRRIPLYLGALCAILIVGIVSYTAFWTWCMRKVNTKWEALPSSLAPAVAVLGLISFGLLAVALWPVWNFMTLPLLFTLFMASMVVAPHLTFWFFTVDGGCSSALRTD